MLTVTAGLEPLTSPDGDTDRSQTRQISATGASFDQAREVLRAQVPDGWRIVWLRTGP